MLLNSTPRRTIALVTVLALMLIPAVIKAVYVTPHAVFIDHSSGSGEVTLGNSSENAEEVTVELKFGFPDTDPSGTPFIRFVEDPGPEFPSAADWIRPFPRRIRLEPGDQQVVRLLATPPEDLPDGEYWTRMIVNARGATVPISTGDTAVRAGVSLEIRLITSVTYRKGDVRTGLSLTDWNATVEGDSVVVWVRAKREGNGAYLGTAGFEILSLDGNLINEWSTPVAVYYPMNRRFAFPLESLVSGRYLLKLALVAERSDLAEGQVLPAAPVVDTLEIEVP